MHSSDIARLATITDPQHVKENELAQVYKTNKYHLRMAPVSYELLISFLQDNKFMILLRIVNQHVTIQGKKKKSIALVGVFEALILELDLIIALSPLIVLFFCF